MATACGPVAHQPPSTPVRAPATKHVLVFSDLHFNPFADPALVDSLAHADVSRWREILAGSTKRTVSQYGSDTNYPLLVSTLAAMQRAEPAAELVLFAGDFLGHNFQSTFRTIARDTSAAALAAFTAKTNQFLAQQLADAFPRAQILPALGNNDSGCGDYMSQPEGAFLRSFAEAWRLLVARRGEAVNFVETFASAGHYSAYAPVLGARVVVLNDVYWSPRYANACGSSAMQPGQLALQWLERELADSRSRGEHVLLLTHVPAGVDVFATLKADTLVNMLDTAYAASLVSILRRFESTVRYGIYGHTHMNDFRVIAETGGTPMLATQGIPAVSPIYGNNPAFVVLAIDSASGSIADYAVHALTNLSVAAGNTPAAWSREYDFASDFGGDGLSAATLARVHRAIADDSSVRARYIRFHDTGSGRASILSSWRAYWCGIVNIDPAAFARCYRQQ